MDSTVPIFFTKDAKKQQWPEISLTERPPPVASDKSKSTYYEVTKPFIFLLRILGGFPYTADKGTLRINVCSWWTFYSLVVIALQNTFLFLTTHHIYTQNVDYFDAKLFDVINIMMVIFQAFSPITFYFEISAITKYYAKWYSYEKDLRLCNIFLDGKLKKWVLFLLLVSIPYVLVTSYYQSLVYGNFIHMGAMVFPHCHSALQLSLWCITGVFLHSTARRLMKRIRKVAEDRDPVELAACRRTWLTLAELTADLGNVIGAKLMECLLFASVVLITNCYFIMFFVHALHEGNGEARREEVPGRVYFIILTSLIVTIFCEFGQRCTNVVGSDLLQELLRLNVLPQEKQLHQEVNIFIQSVWLRYPDMVLCGFLTLNRRLLVSLVSGGITYLIVLVQFRSSSDQSH